MLQTESIAVKTGPGNKELLFQVVILVLAGIAGLSCWLVAAALAHHDALRGVQPDQPR